LQLLKLGTKNWGMGRISLDLNIIYGIHRSLEPKGHLPQQAWKIDNSTVINEYELLIDVEVLNIDSASFKQIWEEAEENSERVKDIIMATVNERGKQHNPITGSGGMLIGKVLQIGKSHPAIQEGIKVGDEMATLVSLSLTPLMIEEIKEINVQTHQVFIKGKAVLFASGLYAKLPRDLPRNLVLAALDVAGAPAQTAKLVAKDDTVVVLGAGGKSGLLTLYQAMKNVGANGRVIAFEQQQEAVNQIKELGIAHEVYQVDANNPIEALDIIDQITGGKLADVTINCVNVPNTEMTSILLTKDGGKVYFFSMATSFTKAALGAEGVGKDIEMLIGNGYTKNHANHALEIIRESQGLRDWFSKKYCKETGGV